VHPHFDQRRYLIPFRSGLLPQIFTDVLVIGGGVAGLRAAIEVSRAGQSAGLETIVLAKGDLKTSNTAWAQGGIAAVRDEADSFDAHVRDTLEAGAGLCDLPATRLIIEAGPAALDELISWGLRVDRDRHGRPLLGREGGHSAARILHADGDATGRELQRCLADRARASERVRVFENCFALDLLTPSPEPGSPVLGAITFHAKYRLQIIWARCTILATGGAGVVYRETTNPPLATADGLAMAYRAGATLADLAFVQFHPTTLYLPGSTRELISEAVRGEGAYLLDAAGRRFMLEEHPRAELAPRDVVSRAIVRAIARQGGQHVWLDCRHLPDFASRFPGIFATLRRFNLDPARDLIPVHPAAHYMVGGVRTDLSARTDVPGLLAAGEVASTGVHGANRLASNSLLEGLVMGRIAGRSAVDAANGHPAARPVALVSDIRPSDHGELDLADVRSSLRSAMWKNVGIERSAARLDDAADMFDFWARYTLDKIFDDPAGWETQNMLLVGALIARSARWRRESRGCHWRADAPDPLDDYRLHDLWRRGEAELRTVHVRDESPAEARA
jgi:L-aspartate oxidase